MAATGGNDAIGLAEGLRSVGLAEGAIFRSPPMEMQCPDGNAVEQFRKDTAERAKPRPGVSVDAGHAMRPIAAAVAVSFPELSTDSRDSSFAN